MGLFFVFLDAVYLQKYKCINNHTYTYHYPYIQKGFRNVFIIKNNYFMMHLFKIEFSEPWTSIYSVALKFSLGKIFLSYLEINIFWFWVFKNCFFKDGITNFLRICDAFFASFCKLANTWACIHTYYWDLAKCEWAQECTNWYGSCFFFMFLAYQITA